MTFGEKIQKLRKEHGLSQEELSVQLDVTRQAISKWETDNGYPETEKIIRMSKMFGVTLDYLLTDEKTENIQAEVDPNVSVGIYISREKARGFLSYQQHKLLKLALAIGLAVASLSSAAVGGIFLLCIVAIVAVIEVTLLFSIFLCKKPYQQIWRTPLLFDKEVEEELLTAYTDKKKICNILITVGIGLIFLSFLCVPILTSLPQHIFSGADTPFIMILIGAGLFLCVYFGGILRSYNILIKNCK